MSYINEPKGADFLIKSPPLTNDEKKEISDVISKLKKKNKSRKRKANENRKQQQKV